MSRRAQLPDGTILEFPDDTPDAVMDRAVRQHLAPNKAAPQQDDQSALNAFVLGARKPIDNMAGWLSNTSAGRAIDQFGQSIGLPSTRAANEEANALRSANTRTGWQLAGNIAGTLPTARLPGGAFTQGAASGALLSDREGATGIATDALIGGVTGKATQGVLNAIGNAMNPAVSAASRKLYEAGIPQTIGQIAQGGKSLLARGVAAGEDALTSVPFLGDVVNAARARGVDAFNSAVANRALKNIGEAVPKGMEPGIDMVDFVGDRLSAKYQQLVPKLVGAFDNGFQADLAAAKQVTSVLPAARQRQFAQIVKDVFGNRARGARITGPELKQAESRLTTLAKQYAKSTDADQKILSEALFDVRQALRNSVMRANPSHAKELQALNKGWAQLATFEKAANAPGNATGVVSPAQMLAASRQSGFRDDLSRAAKEILPSRMPDSGTPRRAMQAMGGMALAGGAGVPAFGPSALLLPGVITPYTKKGQDIINAFAFASRPKILQKGAKAVNALARPAASAAPAATRRREGK